MAGCQRQRFQCNAGSEAIHGDGGRFDQVDVFGYVHNRAFRDTDKPGIRSALRPTRVDDSHHAQTDRQTGGRAAERVHVVTAKAGLVGMTRALAHDLAADKITVNCVAPGLIDTVRAAASASAQPKHHAQHSSLLGRRGTAQEVAQSVVFLAGDGARFITGQVLHVNGGAYLGA